MEDSRAEPLVGLARFGLPAGFRLDSVLASFRHTFLRQALSKNVYITKSPQMRDLQQRLQCKAGGALDRFTISTSTLRECADLWKDV